MRFIVLEKVQTGRIPDIGTAIVIARTQTSLETALKRRGLVRPAQR
jgi:hypothetical protein